MNNENSISSNYDETPLKKGNVYQRIVDDHDEDETRSKDNPEKNNDDDYCLYLGPEELTNYPEKSNPEKIILSIDIIIIFFLILLLELELKDILKGQKKISSDTITEAFHRNMDLKTIRNILESKDLMRVVKEKYGIRYFIKDLIRLNNGVWLNDEIININILRILSKFNLKGDFHIFSTHFMSYLCGRSSDTYDYSAVERFILNCCKNFI